jgi:PadR family transcriptional regulator AphA
MDVGATARMSGTNENDGRDETGEKDEGAPISVLGYALLSLLARVPLSGYDLTREMRKPHSFFFGQAHISRIYPELARLEAAGLVTSSIIEQRSRPDKKVYTLSALGWQRLKAWVVAPTPILEARSEFLIKAHSLWLADPAKVLVQFRAQERYHQEQLAAYERDLADVEQRWGAALVHLDLPPFGDYLTVKRGVGYEREYLAWLQWVIALLEERAQRQPPERPSE